MPRRTDIHTILIIGSGPIVIGQGCEFDYSGVQACRALREEGYRIVLINSNPATIMTDPQFADATYVEPITVEAVEKILVREAASGFPIDAILPTLGGQTGLNIGMACFDRGILTKHNVRMIGADREAIFRGEDRQVFKDLMLKIGLKVPRSGVVHSIDEARKVLDDLGLPLIIRPAFTLGGTGGGIAYNVDEFESIVQRGLDASPATEVLIEQSVIGWKEFELELMRDRNDNVVVICSIENMDPMGVHTGDSITVAPIQTLTDKEYQRMRDAAIAVIRAVGVETGGSNIQFAVNPKNGEMVVVEMNPRVSRSSALASKATGYPIAKIAAKLAVGYTLDELPNPITTRKRPATTDARYSVAPRSDSIAPRSDSIAPRGDSIAPRGDSIARSGDLIARSGDSIAPSDDVNARSGEPEARSAHPKARSGERKAPLNDNQAPQTSEAVPANVREDYELYTSACFEPTIDYCVIKIPRWTFEKFQDADETLTTQMKSVGEAMAIGRTFKEALQKGIRSMEVKRFGFGLDRYDKWLNAQRGAQSQAHGSGAISTDSDKTTQGESLDHEWPIPDDKLRRKLTVPSQGRLYYVRYAMKMGWTIDQIHELTNIDRWFLAQMHELEQFEDELRDTRADLSADSPFVRAWKTGETITDPQLLTQREQIVSRLRRAKQLGYSDRQLSILHEVPPELMRQIRKSYGFAPVYKLVDSCAAEFEAATPYYYSTYETPFEHVGIDAQRCLQVGERIIVESKTSIRVVEDEIRLTDKPKVIIIGGGPNRIGQGIEFDYCCVQAAFAMREMGIESVMINSNPETVSTDYDTSDLLFFEPLTHEDILNICERLNGQPFGRDAMNRAGLVRGVIVQLGGQTPLNLARGLQNAGVPIIGTSVDSIERAGDREQFRELLHQLGLQQPANGIARNIDDAKRIAKEVGYPVLVRPSFVLGGRAMEIVSDEEQLDYYMTHAVEASTIADAPILVDKFIDAATECDVDCIADYDAGAATGRAVVIGVMEHIEEAGIHSGDSACALPPYSLPVEIVTELKRQTRELARSLCVRGLMNVQYAIRDGEIYVIEVNPRASRTVPFVGKATGVPWAKIAAKVMAGMSLDELGINELPDPPHVSVKESVFPFTKFPGVDVVLGPEMRSTGEVMGIDTSFPIAFAKSQLAAGTVLPTSGVVFISVRNADKQAVVPVAKQLIESGLQIVASTGTHAVLKKAGVEARRAPKLAEGRPNVIDMMKNGDVQLIINTPTKKGPDTDEGKIRAAAVLNNIPMLTTVTAASAAAKAIAAIQKDGWNVKPLQEYHADHSGNS